MRHPSVQRTQRSAEPIEHAPWPFHDADEIEAVVRVLRSGRTNYWTGDEGRAFEQEFARAFGCRYGIALANGTLALDLVWHALGIGGGDEVIVTPRSFVASASTIALTGATPVFADVDPDSQNITAESIAAVLTGRTRAILAVHLAGWPCEMDPIMDLARANRLKVIEDCAQAHGATYKGRPVGSFGDAAAFSLCQDKILTTGGEGGMLITSNEDIWRLAWSYKDHGKSQAAVHRSHPPGFRWLHESFGSNFRMTEPQAALGRAQLRKLPAWLARRRRNAALLTERLRALEALRVPEPAAHIGHAYYKHYAFLRPERLRLGWDRDRILATLGEAGIPSFSGICPEVYREKAFERAALGPKAPLPNARRLGETSLMFLVHPTLEPASMMRVADAVAEVVAAASL